jgi:vacuolar protein sorting-associated protein VTA1
MEPHDKQISYYCSLYALQQSMKIMETSPSPEVTQWVHSMFSDLEVLKKQIGALKTKDYFEKFVLSVFAGADIEDRRQGADKTTASKFLVCSQFIEVMNVFEPLPPDWEEKRLYCKWKARDINAAIKEGRRPLPGGPSEQQEVAFEETKGTTRAADQFSQGMTYTPSQETPQGPPQAFHEPPSVPKQPFNEPPSSVPRQPIHEPPSVSRQPIHEPDPRPKPHSYVDPAPPSKGRAPLTPEDRAAIQSAIKLCKNAVSELEFKKVSEAKNWLRQALSSLSQFPD